MRISKKQRECRRKKLVLLAAILSYTYSLTLMEQRRKRRFWIRPFLQERQVQRLIAKVNADDEGLSRNEILQRGYFKAYLRMPYELFTNLLTKVDPLIRKQETNYRTPISSLER